MSRATYVFDRERLALVPAAEFYGRRAAVTRRARGDFPTPMLASDYAGYDCPVTGKWIEGRRAHEENLKLHGCRVLEPGETRDAMAGAERRFEETMEKTIDAALDRVAPHIDA